MRRCCSLIARMMNPRQIRTGKSTTATTNLWEQQACLGVSMSKLIACFLLAKESAHLYACLPSFTLGGITVNVSRPFIASRNLLSHFSPTPLLVAQSHPSQD